MKNGDLIRRDDLRKEFLRRSFYPVAVKGALDQAPAVAAVPVDDEFGLILNFAVRYACGRRTYAPSSVVNFITHLIPHLDDATLATFDKDLTETQYAGGYGDPKLDEPLWREFHALVRQERNRRGHELYKSWR